MTHIMYVMSSPSFTIPHFFWSSQLPPKWYVPTRPQQNQHPLASILNGGWMEVVGSWVKNNWIIFFAKKDWEDLWISMLFDDAQIWWWRKPHHLRRSFWGAKESQMFFFVEISRSNHRKGWRFFPFYKDTPLKTNMAIMIGKSPFLHNNRYIFKRLSYHCDVILLTWNTNSIFQTSIMTLGSM